MRENFTDKTKSILAQRVAYRCSFPGCTRITVGPGNRDNEHVVLLGEAAHIYSASPNGPRNNADLSAEEKSSVDNGIWMCKAHARLIDVDQTIYSAETLVKWKQDAENFVRERLETLERENFSLPLTLVMLDINLIFQGRWIYVHEETWKFRIYTFVEGSITLLQDYIGKFSERANWNKYVVVESQGDGRVLSAVSLEMDDEGYVLSCDLNPKLPRTNPHEVGTDLAMGDDGDLVIENGDFKLVKGIECALQIISKNLSSEFGWWANPALGSNFKSIYKNYQQCEQLNSLVKLEIVRLLTVPASKGIFDNGPSKPELNFINRINWVKVQPHDPLLPYLPLRVSLEWGNNETWDGELKIHF